MNPALPITIAAPVQAALAAGKPVVALESTVISHGLPYPENLTLAQAMETIIQSAGVTAATIGVLGGEIKVGLSAGDLEHLATATDVVKVSRRDFPVVMAQKRDGATTVAGTILIAHLAGIRVMATGGIGGVHHARFGSPWDVSADLPELARAKVVVVCAGAKAILDLPATLEWLETYGVPVIGYGVDELPAFFTPHSGLQLEARADTPAEVAAIANAKWQLGLEGGVLVTAPPPADAAAPKDVVDAAIATALRDAQAAGVQGKAATPFLLARVAALTGGVSLRANLALLQNNARLAAAIAPLVDQPE